MKTINEAFETFKDIDFDIYIDKLKKHLSEDIRPMINERMKANKEFMKIANNYPDKELGKAEGMQFLAKRIIQDKSIIYAIRAGDIAITNFKAVAERIADAKTLIEYYEPAKQEPTAPVKALIVYKKYNGKLEGYSLLKKIEKIKEHEGWESSTNSIKNHFDAIGKGTPKDPVSMKNLSALADLMKMKNKEREDLIKEFNPQK